MNPTLYAARMQRPRKREHTMFFRHRLVPGTVETPHLPGSGITPDRGVNQREGRGLVQGCPGRKTGQFR